MIKLFNITTQIGRIQSIFSPSKNMIKASNKGVRAIMYGSCNDEYVKPGIIHFFTASRYKGQLQTYTDISASCSDEAISTMNAIDKSVPKSLKNAFTELISFPAFWDNKVVESLARTAASVRRVYDFKVSNPVAKTKRAGYFAWQNISEKLLSVLHKQNKVGIDTNYVRKVLPDYIKIPENLSEKEAIAFLTETLKKCGYSEKEIQAVLKKKQPKFYRFVDITELRALKNGEKIRSTAQYHSDLGRTDITSDPNYNFNTYRITFKKKKDWNPYVGEKVEAHDLANGKWWLYGGYSKPDVLCVERVY